MITLFNAVGDYGKVTATEDKFELVLQWGDKRLLEHGWTYHPGPGMPCIYSAKTRSAVRAAQELGYGVAKSASDLFDSQTFADNPQYAIGREADRMRRVQEQKERERMFWEQVKVIEAKLTGDEIATLQAAYRD